MGIRAGTDISPGIRGVTCAALVMCVAAGSAIGVVAGTPGPALRAVGQGPAVDGPDRTGARRAEQAAPPYDTLIARLDQLPIAREADARHDAAVARAEQAQARPNPVVAFDVENALGTGMYAGYRRADTTVSISQAVDLWGQHGARIDAARAEADVIGVRRDQLRLWAAGRLAQVYVEAEAAARRYDLAQQALALAEEDAAAARALVDEGREPALRGIQAESEVQAARAIVAEAVAARAAAFAWLTAAARLNGTPDSIPSSLLDRAPARATPASGEALSVRLAEAERDAADQVVTVERLRARPGLSATVGVQRLDETDDAALAFGVSVSVPLFDRNHGAIAAARAEQRAAEARLVAARDDAIAQRRAAEASLDASADRTAAADRAVATAEEAYRLARIGFEAGRISQLELRASRAALVAAENAAVDARLARVLAEIELARVEGRVPFGRGPGTP